MGGFKIRIIVTSQTITLNRKFKYDEKIKDIKQCYYDNEDNQYTVDKMNLVHNGQALEDEKNIEYYDDDIDRFFTCVLTFRCGGGTKINDEKDDEKISLKKQYKIGLKIPNRQRVLSDSAKKKLKLTNKECCMLGGGENNIIMGCGHIFCSDFIFDYVHNEFSKNNILTEIICPILNCKKEWKWKEWTRAACLYDDEYDAFEFEIQKRLAPETRICPNCNKTNTKPDDLRMKRINCVCNGDDWCWLCGLKWIGGGFIFCGNKQCISNEMNKTLQSCKTKNLGSSYGNIIVPEWRACPKCYTLIFHETACKHMHCKICNNNFCFSCLKSPNKDGKWPCKAYNFACPPASRQSLK